MAERSPARDRDRFSRSRLFVGLVLVILLGAGLAFAAGRFRSAPSAGRVVYAARQGVFTHDLSTGEDKLVAHLPDDVELAIPSPDGRWVGYAEGAGAVSIASLTEVRSFEVAARFSIPVGWSPDSRLVFGELVGDRDLVAIKPDGERTTASAVSWPQASQAATRI